MVSFYTVAWFICLLKWNKRGTNLQYAVVILSSCEHQCSLRFAGSESEADGAGRLIKWFFQSITDVRITTKCHGFVTCRNKTTSQTRLVTVLLISFSYSLPSPFEGVWFLFKTRFQNEYTAWYSRFSVFTQVNWVFDCLVGLQKKQNTSIVL